MHQPTNLTLQQPPSDLATRFLLRKEYFGNWFAFTSIFGHIFTAHTQKLLYFRTAGRNSDIAIGLIIKRPRFPKNGNESTIRRRFQVFFSLYKSKICYPVYLT